MCVRRRLIVVLVVAASACLVALRYFVILAPAVNLAVSVLGSTNDVAGAPMTILSITNRGGTRAVIWGYYTIEGKQDLAVRHPTVFSGRYFLVAPGQSQIVTVHVPETRGSWKVSIGYGSYNLRCRWGLFATHLPPVVRDAIPQRFRDVPKDLVASSLIE